MKSLAPLLQTRVPRFPAFPRCSLQPVFLMLTLILSHGVFGMQSAGGEITYTCTGTPDVYLIKVKLYNDCNGIAVCPNCPTSLSSGCAWSVNIKGASGSYVGTSFGTATVNVVTSAGVGEGISLCSSQNTICTNCGTRTAGTYNPGVEVYTFTGLVNLSTVPAACCKVNIGFTFTGIPMWEGNIIGPGSNNQYISTTIDRCQAACNNGVQLSNKPELLALTGLDYYTNPGAFDPDGDSISIELAPFQTGFNVNGIYISPYSAQAPLPYLGFPGVNLTAPLGMNIDQKTGDIHFRLTSNFIGYLTLDFKDWRRINGVMTNLSSSRRDLLVYCMANSTGVTNPTLAVYDSLSNPVNNQALFGTEPAKQVCFTIEAEDGGTAADSTFITWNAPTALVQNGAALTPLYNPAFRGTQGPRYDSMRFCWTPPQSVKSINPYYFTITAKDRSCPLNGRMVKTFGILVWDKPDSFTYTPDSFTTNLGTGGASGLPLIAWKGVTGSFALESTIPGVSLNPGTGIVYWNSAVPPGIYHINLRAGNIIGTTTTHITLTITGAAPTAVQYSPSSATFAYGTSGQSPVPQVNWHSDTGTFQLLNAISGISIDSVTGRLKWTSGIAVGSDTLRVRAANHYGSAEVLFILKIQPVAPSGLSYPLDTIRTTYGIGGELNISGISWGGQTGSFSLTGGYLNFITVGAFTGKIAWPAYLPGGIFSFTITATNPAGSTSKTLRMVVQPIIPTNFSYTPSSNTVTYSSGGRSADPEIDWGGKEGLFRLAGTPSGIWIDSVTGVVYWEPTLPVGTYPLTVRASNTVGVVNTSYTIKVQAGFPFGLVYTPDSASVDSGIAGASARPAINWMGNAGTFSIPPVAPGITITDTNGIINWSSHVLPGTYNILVRAQNSVGDANGGFMLRVKRKPTILPGATGSLTAYKLTGFYPNPASGSALVAFELTEKEAVSIDLYDMQGKHVSTLLNEIYPAGGNEAQVELSGVARGIYLCRMTGMRGESAVLKVVIR
jgi:hypothetical protein